MFKKPICPADLLQDWERHRIYYYRVVNLAVRNGLLDSNPTTEVGHFVFSDYYHQGGQLDADLLAALEDFEARFPKAARERRRQKAATLGPELHKDDVQEVVLDLIRIGASYAVWPTGTSFLLTYPWGLDGNPRPVTFRADLSDFVKRRVLAILKQTGKLREPVLFH
jgi:hypothetical protein